MIGYRMETEGRASDGLQLSASVQSQEARHLAGLHEVERVRPSWGGCSIAFHALQLLGLRAVGHHIQFHILRLLLVEQHLRRQREWCTSHQEKSEDIRGNSYFLSLPEHLKNPAFVLFFSFLIEFSRFLSTWQRKTWYSLFLMIHTSKSWLTEQS